MQKIRAVCDATGLVVNPRSRDLPSPARPDSGRAGRIARRSTARGLRRGVASQPARDFASSETQDACELLEAASRTDAAAIRSGFQAYVEAWKESEVARRGSGTGEE